MRKLNQYADEDIKAFGELALEMSRDETPVRIGNLKRSLILESGKPRTAIIRTRTGYGAYVHFGTKRMPANPFIARGIDNAIPEMQSILDKRKA